MKRQKMTNIQTFSSKQEIHQQACEWISRFDRGLSSNENRDFSDWVNISSYHRKSLFDAAKTWDDLSVLNELSLLFPLGKHQLRKTKVLIDRKAMGIAASIIFVVISCLLWFESSILMPSTKEQFLFVLDAETSVGEQQVHTLSDGSIIHLNTDTLVSVHYSHSQRNLTLVRGEALFEVAHDDTRPFNVFAANNIVTAIGTAFNVQLDSPQQFQLLVTEGKVLVKNTTQIHADNPKQETQYALDGIGELMTAGQKALINQDTIQHVPLTKQQIKNDLAWQQGMLVFHGEPLSEALLEISRYTQVDFILADEQVKQRRVAGYFKAGDISGLLFALENNFNIVYSKNNDETIVLATGKVRVQ